MDDNNGNSNGSRFPDNGQQNENLAFLNASTFSEYDSHTAEADNGKNGFLPTSGNDITLSNSPIVMESAYALLEREATSPLVKNPEGSKTNSTLLAAKIQKSIDLNQAFKAITSRGAELANPPNFNSQPSKNSDHLPHNVQVRSPATFHDISVAALATAEAFSPEIKRAWLSEVGDALYQGNVETAAGFSLVTDKVTQFATHMVALALDAHDTNREGKSADVRTKDHEETEGTSRSKVAENSNESEIERREKKRRKKRKPAETTSEEEDLEMESQPQKKPHHKSIRNQEELFDAERFRHQWRTKTRVPIFHHPRTPQKLLENSGAAQNDRTGPSDESTKSLIPVKPKSQSNNDQKELLEPLLSPAVRQLGAPHKHSEDSRAVQINVPSLGTSGKVSLKDYSHLFACVMFGDGTQEVMQNRWGHVTVVTTPLTSIQEELLNYRHKTDVARIQKVVVFYGDKQLRDGWSVDATYAALQTFVKALLSHMSVAEIYVLTIPPAPKIEVHARRMNKLIQDYFTPTVNPRCFHIEMNGLLDDQTHWWNEDDATMTTATALKLFTEVFEFIGKFGTGEKKKTKKMSQSGESEPLLKKN
ncbi:hypothetical protein L596_005603 [Steinernema carpocapsae]|uniref:Uncharacterized protein n=2 Tax=Steinernema carpocapsae TaxID=34508 RepID=A0A4U8V4M7_STECR|nr:hypothetical protein L596_005603 [Steinernema carpocapsae]